MKRLGVVLFVLLVTGAAAQAGASAAHVPAATEGGVSVQVDRTTITTGLGGRFSFSSTVTNRSDQTKSGLIAHLNVLSTDPGTYVDPEDWSSHRTQFLQPLAGHDSTTLTWPVQAVNSGALVLYVAIVNPASGDVAVSAPIELNVKKAKSIDAAGILPLALGVPLMVAALLAGSRIRRRRNTSHIRAQGHT